MSRMTKKTTVVLVDKFEIVRESIISRVSATDDLEVVAEAESGFEALKLARTLSPDIVLLDWEITRLSGLDTLAKIKASCPDIAVIAVSSNPSFETAVMAFASGASGFIQKNAKGLVFLEAMRALANGYVYVPLEYVPELVQCRQNVTRTGNAYGLSRRELEVLDACLAGKSNKEVAGLLDISTRTVETHRNNIYRKTNCHCLEDLSRVVQGDEKLAL